MSKVTITESSLTAIGNAIRTKLGVGSYYKPSQMAAAIASIPTGSTAVLVAKTITANGTYDPADDSADGYSGVTVNVSGSAPNLQSKTVTQNGTVTPDTGYDGLSSVVVNVSGGGSGNVEEWDLTASLTGALHGITMTAGSVSLSAAGAVFDGTSDYLSVPVGWNGITAEIDVASMSLTSGTHRRFIMPTQTNGLIYRSTGVWAFYNGSWVESTETDGSFFDGSTVKVYVDASGYWHIYKDDVLWWEPGVVQAVSGAWYIGSSGGNTINNAVISGVRIT